MNKRKMRRLIILLLINVFLFPLNGQNIKHKQNQGTNTNSPEIVRVFADIEKGLSNGNVAEFSAYFSNQTYLSISNGVSGYYSANQAFYVLQDFLSINTPISFKLSNLVTGNLPYATGILNYESKNRRETAQVFISLENSGGNWKVSQITIK